MAALFWFSLFFIFYTYVGYPCTLWLLTKIRPQPVRKKTISDFPFASVVIAAKNEEKRILSRLSNLAEQHYPGKLEIIVVSDNSTDSTVAKAEGLIENLRSKGIALRILQSDGTGKPSAVNCGVCAASGEIIIFADARQTFMPGALQALVENFSDPSVGCVSGELVFVDREKEGLQVEMGVYWYYEKKIRKMQSATGSIVVATGAIYAVRKDLYRNLPETILTDDVLTPVNILCQKRRVVFDGRAVACDVVSRDLAEEWLRKVRTLTGNWQLVGDENVLGRALTHHFFLRFFWHKVARLLVPFVLPLFLISSFLSEGGFYLFCGYVQLFLCLLALCAKKIPRFSQNPVAKLSYFFCVLNWAAIVGCWTWLKGGSREIWRRKT